jgi:hypothetical protein
MLLANVSVAKKIDEVFLQTAVSLILFLAIIAVLTFVFDQTPFTPARGQL